MKPRILAFFHKREYINRTESLIHQNLSQEFDMFFYGPGYCDVKIDDAKEVFRKYGPFDAIFIDDFSYIYDASIANEYYVFFYDPRAFFREHPIFPINVFDIDKPIFLIMTNCDPYYISLREDWIEKLASFPGKIVGFLGPEYSKPLSLIDKKGEEFTKDVSMTVSDLIHRIGGISKVIHLPHCVGEDEFLEPKSHKKLTICVPGVLYHSRKKAISNIEKSLNILRISNLKPKRVFQQSIISFKRPGTIWPFLRSLLNTLVKLKKMELIDQMAIVPFHAVKSYDPKDLIKIEEMRIRYRTMINQAKYTYTCGSALGYPIRKFFEIPAAGSLLMADPFWNYQVLGFEDMENFVVCLPDDVVKKIQELEENSALYEKILKQSREFIRERHTVSVRISQFRKVFDSIVGRRYDYSFWENGELRINEE